jgi:hypothetical protein
MKPEKSMRQIVDVYRGNDGKPLDPAPDQPDGLCQRSFALFRAVARSVFKQLPPRELERTVFPSRGSAVCPVSYWRCAEVVPRPASTPNGRRGKLQRPAFAGARTRLPDLHALSGSVLRGALAVRARRRTPRGRGAARRVRVLAERAGADDE